jgi:hypothetical protein
MTAILFLIEALLWAWAISTTAFVVAAAVLLVRGER